MAQYVPIEVYWNSVQFHCPVCGAEVFNDQGEPTDRPCEHLLFSWISEVDEYYNLSGHLGELPANEEDCFAPWDDEFLQLCPETSVLFGLKTTGMSCGPVSLTVVHGIKFPEDS